MQRYLTRRYFLKAAPVAVGAAWVAAACGGRQPTATNPTVVPTLGTQGTAQPSPAQTEAPQRGGVLALRITNDPPTIDLHQTTANTDVWPFAPCFDLLIQFDPLDHSRILPDLAERWDISSDRLTYTFHLKTGVTFHDGTPFTSRDVKASFERIIWPPSGVRSPRQPLFDSVERIETPDEATVQFVLREPDESLLYNIAQAFNVIYPARLVEAGADFKDPSNLIGTGPFRFKNYTPGVSVELERNPNYHVPDQPYLDGIITYIIPDENGAVNAFISGQLHLYRTQVTPPIDLLEAQVGPDLVVSHIPRVGTFGVDLNSAFEPWRDPSVRLAASLAIDRDAAIQVLTKGYGKISGYMHPDGRWALPEERLREAAGFGRNPEENVARAKQLLAEAGYADGFDVVLLTSRGERDEAAMNFVRDQWAKVGIRARLEVEQLSVFLQRRYQDRNYDACESVHGPAVDDPKAVFSTWLACDAPLNVSGLCDDSLVSLYRQQGRTADPSVRKQMVNELDFRSINEVASGRILLGRTNLLWSVYRDSVLGGWKPQASDFLTEKHATTWLKKTG